MVTPSSSEETSRNASTNSVSSPLRVSSKNAVVTRSTRPPVSLTEVPVLISAALIPMSITILSWPILLPRSSSCFRPIPAIAKCPPLDSSTRVVFTPPPLAAAASKMASTPPNQSLVLPAKMVLKRKSEAQFCPAPVAAPTSPEQGHSWSILEQNSRTGDLMLPATLLGVAASVMPFQGAMTATPLMGLEDPRLAARSRTAAPPIEWPTSAMPAPSS
mmetsp:Transcript_2486/g.8450  ORF Transcript_2486/g.8450 Transcript_2486/m.8450 type:complete len:217 (+) Transcript_2486:3295-3945(+)